MNKDKIVYDAIHSFLCDNKCKLNTWYEFKYINADLNINMHCEVMLPSKGNMRTRIPVKKHMTSDEGEMIYQYYICIFTNKRELVHEGLGYGTRSEVEKNHRMKCYFYHYRREVLQMAKGEYFVDYDEETASYCIFHTDIKQGHAYGSFASESEAWERAEEWNNNQ